MGARSLAGYTPIFHWWYLHQILTEEEKDERIHTAYGKNYERLVEVKTKWDPENMFRMNKN